MPHHYRTWNPRPGSAAQRSVLADTPDDLIAAAAKLRDEATERIQRATEYEAEATRWRADVARYAQEAGARRRARLAATRERKRNPFGLRSIGD